MPFRVAGERLWHVANATFADVVQKTPFGLQPVARIARVVMIRFQNSGHAALQANPKNPVVAPAGERFDGSSGTSEPCLSGKGLGQFMRRQARSSARTQQQRRDLIPRTAHLEASLDIRTIRREQNTPAAIGQPRHHSGFQANRR